MPTLTRRRSLALAKDEALTKLLDCPTALAKLAEHVGLLELNVLSQTCRALNTAASNAKWRWHILSPFVNNLADDAPIKEALYADGTKELDSYYLCGLGSRGFALAKTNRILLFRPLPLSGIPMSHLTSIPMSHLLGAAADMKPDLRGIAFAPARTSGPSDPRIIGDLYLVERPPDVRAGTAPASHVIRRFPTIAFPTLRLDNPRTSPSSPRLEYPSGLTVCANRLFVTDTLNHRVVCYDTASPLLMRHEYSFGGFGSAPGQLFTPYGLDACVKHVYVCDNGNNRVSVHHASDGRFEAVLGGGSGDAHTLHQPRDCALVTNGAEPSRLIVTEATRLVVLSLPSGAPMQLLRINGARSLWGVCVFAERDSLFRSWHREILSSGVSGEAAAGPLQRTGQVAVVDVELNTLYHIHLEAVLE